MSNEQNFTPILSAIMGADVKGCFTLMSEDKFFSIKTLKDYRQSMAGNIIQHFGRVVNECERMLLKTKTRHSQMSVEKQGGINDEENFRN